MTEYRLDSCGDNILKMIDVLVRCSLISGSLLVTGLSLIGEGPLVWINFLPDGCIFGTSLLVSLVITKLLFF